MGLIFESSKTYESITEDKRTPEKMKAILLNIAGEMFKFLSPRGIEVIECGNPFWKFEHLTRNVPSKNFLEKKLSHIRAMKIGTNFNFYDGVENYRELINAIKHLDEPKNEKIVKGWDVIDQNDNGWDDRKPDPIVFSEGMYYSNIKIWKQPENIFV